MDEGTTRLKPLETGQPGRVISVMSRFSDGIRDIAEQITPYTRWWDEQNQNAVATEGPVLVVLGDSSALGIGASHPSKGYVKLVQEHLVDRDEQPWRVINLAKSGAKLDDALERQLVELQKIDQPDLVVSCVGSNDIFWTLSTFSLQRKLKRLVDALPSHSVVAALAGSSPRSKASNTMLEKLLEDRPQHFVNPWGMPGPPGAVRLAADKFHPNDIGYELIAKAFTNLLDTDTPVVGRSR